MTAIKVNPETVVVGVNGEVIMLITPDMKNPGAQAMVIRVRGNRFFTMYNGPLIGAETAVHTFSGCAGYLRVAFSILMSGALVEDQVIDMVTKALGAFSQTVDTLLLASVLIQQGEINKILGSTSTAVEMYGYEVLTQELVYLCNELLGCARLSRYVRGDVQGEFLVEAIERVAKVKELIKADPTIKLAPTAINYNT